MEEKDKIAIMLEEYRLLRSELIQRNTVLISILTVGGNGQCRNNWCDDSDKCYLAGTITISIIMLVLSYAFWIIDYDTRRLAFRVRQIEAEINRRANDRLLLWETEHGLKPGGFVPKLMARVQQFYDRPPF
jgi:hypothetical protein